MEGREHLSAEVPPARPGHPQPRPGGWTALWGWPGARGRKSGEEALAKQGCGAGGFQPSPVLRPGPLGGCEAPLTVQGRQGEAEDLRGPGAEEVSGQSVSCEPSTRPSTCQASLRFTTFSIQPLQVSESQEVGVLLVLRISTLQTRVKAWKSKETCLRPHGGEVMELGSNVSDLRGGEAFPFLPPLLPSRLPLFLPLLLLLLK